MEGYITWAALVAAIGSLATAIKLWLWIGARLQKADAAERISVAALAKADLAISQVAEHRVETAATAAAISGLHSTMEGVRSEIARTNTRLDDVFKLMIERLNPKV